MWRFKSGKYSKNLVWAQTQIPSEFWDEVLALPFSSDDPEANRVYTPG